MVNLLEGRPGKNNFTLSPVLQEFALATNVRIRLLTAKTLQGHLMDLNERNDPSVTRRVSCDISHINYLNLVFLLDQGNLYGRSMCL